MPDRRTWPFVIAFASVAFAFFSPLEAAAETSLSAHMVQHLVLVAVTGPFFAAARPIPPELRRRLPPLDVGWLAGAVVLQVAVLMVWHVPALYDEAVAHVPLHIAEHLTLIGSAFVLWTCLLDGNGLARPLGVVALFLTSLAPMAYGVGLTLATTPWYPTYESLPDQRLAGVWMWAGGGTATVIGGVALFARWLAQEEPAP